jgi:hypothetical protein
VNADLTADIPPEQAADSEDEGNAIDADACEACDGLGYRWKSNPAGTTPPGDWWLCQNCAGTGRFDQQGPILAKPAPKNP